MSTPGTTSGEPEWVEALLPVIMIGLFGLVLWVQRMAILGWLAGNQLLLPPPKHPPIVLYAGYGIDYQRALLLVLPTLIAITTALVIGAAITRNIRARSNAATANSPRK